VIFRNLKQTPSQRVILSINNLFIGNFVIGILIISINSFHQIIDISIKDEKFTTFYLQDVLFILQALISTAFALFYKQFVKRNGPIGVLYLDENENLIVKKLFHSVVIPQSQLTKISIDNKYVHIYFKEGLYNLKFNKNLIPKEQLEGLRNSSGEEFLSELKNKP
jgi:hypothetical protein